MPGFPQYTIDDINSTGISTEQFTQRNLVLLGQLLATTKLDKTNKIYYVGDNHTKEGYEKFFTKQEQEDSTIETVSIHRAEFPNKKYDAGSVIFIRPELDKESIFAKGRWKVILLNNPNSIIIVLPEVKVTEIVTRKGTQAFGCHVVAEHTIVKTEYSETFDSILQKAQEAYVATVRDEEMAQRAAEAARTTEEAEHARAAIQIVPVTPGNELSIQHEIVPSPLTLRGIFAGVSTNFMYVEDEAPNSKDISTKIRQDDSEDDEMDIFNLRPM